MYKREFQLSLCGASDTDISYYSFLLQFNIIAIIGCTLLVLITWFIIKVSLNDIINLKFLSLNKVLLLSCISLHDENFSSCPLE